MNYPSSDGVSPTRGVEQVKQMRALVTARSALRYFSKVPSFLTNRPRYVKNTGFWVPPARPLSFQPKRNDVSVATLLDEFSAEAFHPECVCFPVTPFNWRNVLRRRPDFFSSSPPGEVTEIRGECTLREKTGRAPSLER